MHKLCYHFGNQKSRDEEINKKSPWFVFRPPITTTRNSIGSLPTNRRANTSLGQRQLLLPWTNFASKTLDLLAISPSFAIRLVLGDDRNVSTYIIQIDGIMMEDLRFHDCSASNKQATDTQNIILTCKKSNIHTNSISFFKKIGVYFTGALSKQVIAPS